MYSQFYILQTVDEDSEAEKLSPLLQKSEQRSNNLALNMADVLEPIDDTDTDHEEMVHMAVPDKSKSSKDFQVKVFLIFELPTLF